MIKKQIIKKRKTNIETALRRVWNYYDPARKAVIARCKIDANKFKCEICGQLFKNITVHHIVPIATKKQGASIRSICTTLFIDETWLKGVCTECHKMLHRKKGGSKNGKTQSTIKQL